MDKRLFLNKTKKKLYRARKPFLALGILILLVFIIKFIIFSFSDDRHTDYFNSSYKFFGITIPKDLNFAGEQVPVSDLSVREGLEREFMMSTYWQYQTLLIHKRAHRWLPLIEPILKKYGVPDDFKYLAITESYLTNSVSPRQAAGFWQIMESTARVYNLEVNDEVDERFHVQKSTEAACKYFKEAYKRFGNWTLVAASYNLGMGGIAGQLEKQKVVSFYDLQLNEETSCYLFRVLAMKEIISNPKKYGYIIRKKDLYPPLATYAVTVDSAITNLAGFAIKQGVNYKTLIYFNPWLRKDHLDNKAGKKYSILLPKNKKNLYVYDEEVGGNSPVSAGPDTTKALTQPVVAKDSSSVYILHKVKENETIVSLALVYKVDENMIRMWNKISRDEDVKPGMEIVVYPQAP